MPWRVTGRLIPLLRPDSTATDGHVITQAVQHVSRALAATAQLAAGYDQIESSVGQFGTDRLIADTKALASGSSSDDTAYRTEQQTLLKLANDRDRVVTKIKKVLNGAAHNEGFH